MTRAGTGSTVTIGLPVFNGEPWLEAALDSLRAQAHEDLVIHVADNASTDGTEDICRRAAAEDDRIVYERHAANLGAVANFNHVAAAARTPWFKWAAADDLHLPDFVGACLAALDERPNAVLAHPRTQAIDEHGDPVVVDLIPGPGLPRVDYLDYRNTVGADNVGDPDPVRRYRRVMRDLWFTVQLYGVMRTDVLQRTQLHPHHYMGDHILLSELVLHGPFAEVDRVLFHRRIHPGQTSAKAGHLERLAVAVEDRSAPPGKSQVASAYPERFRLHLQGVRRAPLTPGQRARCAAVLGGAVVRWGRRRLTGTAVEELPSTSPGATS